MAAPPLSASPNTRPSNWATSSMSNCPTPGKKLAAGGEAAVVESVKAASEVYAPASGEVTEANAALAADPAKVNADPEGDGWFFKMKLADPGELQEADDQRSVCGIS